MCAAYLHEQLDPLGPVEEHHFQEGSEAGTNLILRFPGQQPSLDPLLMGAAHYDGPLHSIGADDNATAVATLLELARRWSQSPPRRPVWLVAFDQEEWGMLGSRALARDLRQAGQNGSCG
ncbi:MAG: M20/M25/M40 family metallo-hydrolase [Prochlorococcaceae cyanobacterium]